MLRQAPYHSVPSSASSNFMWDVRSELTGVYMLDQQPITELFLSSLLLFVLTQDLSATGWPKPLFVEVPVSKGTCDFSALTS